MKDIQNQTRPILVAITTNLIIAISKGVGFIFSGSSALLSEAIHSVADVMNQALLYIGIRRGEKEENEIFQYGYSQERFFWNLISAMGVFILGCGVTIYHGVHDLLSNEPKSSGSEILIIEIILLISFLAEGYSFFVVLKEIRGQANTRRKKFFKYLKESLDPSISAVFWEDSAALLGILLAFVGIGLSHLTGNDSFDAIASILIGLLMGWIAFHLASENKKFLLDRSIPEYELNNILSELQKKPGIMEIKDIKSVVLGPNRLKLSAKIQFDHKLLAEKLSKELIAKLKRNKSKLNNKGELENLLEEYNKKFLANASKEIEKIEKKLQDTNPELKHIDFRI